MDILLSLIGGIVAGVMAFALGVPFNESCVFGGTFAAFAVGASLYQEYKNDKSR